MTTTTTIGIIPPMPLKITTNGATYKLGPENGTLETIDKIKIHYAGDGYDRVEVSDHDGATLGKFTMTTVGFATKVEYVVHVAPVELGESTTPVKRQIGLERI